MIIGGILLSIVTGAQVRDTSILVDEKTIYFAYDSSSLLPAEKSKLRQLPTVSFYRIEIVGHTDGDGSNEYNHSLGKMRASQVRHFLMDSLGWDSIDLIDHSRGEEDPVADNATSHGKSQNRRVKISVYWDTPVRYFSGNIISDSIDADQGMVFLQSKYYRDSFLIKNGKFTGFAPEGHYVKLIFGAPDHFYRDTIIKIGNNLSGRSIEAELPYLMAGQRYELPDFHFIGDQTALLKRSKPALDALRYSMINSKICIVIEGHVNAPNRPPMTKGSRQWNLAVNRSKMICQHLIEAGVDSLRMNPIGYSNFYMKYPNQPNANQQIENRRVEIYIKDCDSLYEFTQEDVVIPEVLGEQKRIHHIQN